MPFAAAPANPCAMTAGSPCTAPDAASKRVRLQRSLPDCQQLVGRGEAAAGVVRQHAHRRRLVERARRRCRSCPRCRASTRTGIACRQAGTAAGDDRTAAGRSLASRSPPTAAADTRMIGAATPDDEQDHAVGVPRAAAAVRRIAIRNQPVGQAMVDLLRRTPIFILTSSSTVTFGSSALAFRIYSASMLKMRHLTTSSDERFVRPSALSELRYSGVTLKMRNLIRPSKLRSANPISRTWRTYSALTLKIRNFDEVFHR